MKTITKLSYAFFICASLALSSCSDDDSSSNGGTPSGEFVKAKVNGQNFSSSTTFDAVGASHPQASTVVIQGSNDQGHAIQLMIMNYDGPGTYDVSDMTGGQALYTQASPFTSYSSAAGGVAEGEVTITEMTDTQVEGEFSFVGKETDGDGTVEVTQGQFRANFQ